MMRFDFTAFKSELSGYAELRAQMNTECTVAFVNGHLAENSRTVSRGNSARVARSSAWGFASSPELSDASIRETIRDAVTNAEFLQTKRAGRSFAFAQNAVKVEQSFATKKTRWSQKDVADFVGGIDQLIQRKYPQLKGRRVRLYSLDMEKSVLTSTGAELYQLIPRVHITVQLIAEGPHGAISISENVGGLGQFEDWFLTPTQVEAQIDELYEKLMQKKEAVHAEAGIHDVILAPNLAGILAHEAVGHTAEADLVLGGSVAGDCMDREVASPLISLVDFAHTAFGATCPVPVFADDEGTLAEDCVVIDKGILRRFMHNKETAEHFQHAPQGNARAFNYSDEPLIRMRNTAILPGQSKLAEMIGSVEKGYLLSHPGNGQADSTGEFMFAVNVGYEIRNGKLGRAIFDTTISGVAFEMLKSATMVSDDMVWVSSGFCGKKQRMSVGMGGPAIKCRVSIGGR
jgi:TldD protein